MNQMLELGNINIHRKAKQMKKEDGLEYMPLQFIVQKVSIVPKSTLQKCLACII